MKQAFLRLTVFLSLVVLVFVGLQVQPAVGQTETGLINGTVTDQSGAVVPKARITIRGVNTGSERQSESDEHGFYVVTNLQPGLYSVTAEAANLNKSEQRVEVTVGARVELNLKLNVGGSTTVVEVVAEGGVQVNTETATIGTVIDGAKVNEMPTVNRNPYAFAGNVGTASDQDPSARGVGVSFNGLRAASTNILLDGAANNDEFTATVGQPVPLDSVAEYSVLTNNFTAEYGRASGGIVNLATKAGTNGFHGTAYEYNRVSALAANDFFDNANGVPKGEYTRNQFGYSLGGPIKKNKLFFFHNIEWNRIRSAGNQTVYVIDPAFVAASDSKTQGYFSELGTLRSNLTNLGVATVGDVNCGNAPGVIPTGSCAALPTTTPFLDKVSYTVPSDAGAGAPENQLMALARVDWNVSDKTSVYVRYSLDKETLFDGTNNTSAYAGFDTGSTITSNNVLVSMTHSFTNHTTSQSKAVFNRLNNLQPLAAIAPHTTLYFNNAVETTFNTPLGTSPVELPGYSSLTPGNGIPFGGPQNFIQLYQDLSTTKGRHTFRYGGSYNYQRDNRTFGAYENPVGALARTGGVKNSSINNLLDGQLAVFQGAIDPQGHFPCPFPITPGEPCTDPSTGSIDANGNVTTPVGSPVFARSNRYHEFATYAADQWRISNRFTLSLGLRWEYFGLQHNKNAQLDSNFYFGGGSSIFEQIRNGGVSVVPDSPLGGLVKKDWNNFGPKIGMAWDIFGNGKTVLRGGYSIAYERNFGNVTFNIIQNPPNYSVISLIAGVDTPTIDITSDPAGPLAGSGTVKAIPKVSLRAVNPNIVTSYAHLYSLSLEREIRHNIVVGLDFSGSKGEHLYDIANVNRTGAGNIYLGDDPNTVGLTRLKAVQYSNINFRSDNGGSKYNALVARVSTKNWANTGLTINANYTYSHSLDDLSDTFSSSGNNFNLGYLDSFNPKVDYGNSYADLRHRFTLQGIWDVPFARHTHGIAKQVFDGWQVTPIFSAETGAPFSVYDCTNAVTVCMYAVNAAGSSIPRKAPSGALTSVGADDFLYTPLYSSYDAQGNITGTPLFDTSYVNPTVGISDFGPFPAAMNSRNAFRGPGQWHFDIGAAKTFFVGERYKLILRGEFYNAFNHANLYIQGGDTDVSGVPFVDALKGPVGTGRTVQLALRFEF